MNDDWHQMGIQLFQAENIQRPGFLEYSDRQSFPLVITNSCESSQLKIWIMNKDNTEEYANLQPSLVLDKNEVKDYRHFQNFFLQILHPNRLKLEMRLFDLYSGKIMCNHEMVFENHQSG